MAILIQNKQELNQFNIGIEFEFYVATKALKAKEKIPKEILSKYGHLLTVKNSFNYQDAGNYVIQKLNEVYPEEKWNLLLKKTFDHSLNNSNARVGVELILKHESGHITIERLRKICAVLNSPEFITNKDCGLHINLSFKDQSKNQKELIFDILPHLDIEKILEKFGRSKNELCKPNHKTTIKAEVLCQKFLKALGIKDFYSNVSLEKTLNLTSSISNNKELKNIFKSMEETVKNDFIKEWKDSRPAIAPKTKNKQHYLEFRLIGGVNYHQKINEIEDSIDEYLYAMKKA